MSTQFEIQDILKLLFSVIIFYTVFRLFLFFVKEWVGKANIKWQKNWLHILETIITPITLLFGILIGILTNPLWTIILIATVYVTFKDFADNYFLGIYIKLEPKLTKSTNITVNQHSGNINQFGRIGLWIYTDTGLHFVSYKSLHNEGYTINDSSHISTSFNFALQLNEETDPSEVKDLIIGSPFLDSDQKTEFSQDDDKLFVRINLRNKEHYMEFIQFLKENNQTIIKS